MDGGRYTSLDEALGHPAAVEILDLSNLVVLTGKGLRGDRLPSEIGDMVNLQELGLHNLGLSVLPPTMSRLVRLQSLDLSDNRLEQVPAALTGLPLLRRLVLSNNPIMRISPVLGSLPRLEVLDFSDTASAPPPELFTMSGLHELYVYNRFLTEIPPAISSMQHLKLLALRVRPLADLATSLRRLASLPRLETLILAGEPAYDSEGNAGFKDIPAELSSLPHLRRLELTDHALRSPGAALGGLATLEELVMARSEVETLPDAIGRLTHLQRLDLSGNHLKALPRSMAVLGRLENIKLDGNPLPASEIAWLGQALPGCRIHR